MRNRVYRITTKGLMRVVTAKVDLPERSIIPAEGTVRIPFVDAGYKIKRLEVRKLPNDNLIQFEVHHGTELRFIEAVIELAESIQTEE